LSSLVTARATFALRATGPWLSLEIVGTGSRVLLRLCWLVRVFSLDLGELAVDVREQFVGYVAFTYLIDTRRYGYLPCEQPGNLPTLPEGCRPDFLGLEQYSMLWRFTLGLDRPEQRFFRAEHLDRGARLLREGFEPACEAYQPCAKE